MFPQALTPINIFFLLLRDVAVKYELKIHSIAARINVREGILAFYLWLWFSIANWQTRITWLKISSEARDDYHDYHNLYIVREFSEIFDVAD